MSIQKIIQESINGKPLEMKEAFAEELKDRIAEALAAKMEEVELDEGFVGRETKDGTWRVFKTGNPVAVAGPFKSAQETQAWIKKQSMQEEVDLDEAVEVRHDRYMRSHGKKASGGSGNWMFTHKAMGDVDHNDKKQVYTAPSGKFSDAKKSAQEWAKKHGHSTVYVMEEVEQIDEVSKKTLGSYIKKAAERLPKHQRDASAAAQVNSIDDYKKSAKMRDNRKLGIQRAADRLTK